MTMPPVVAAVPSLMPERPDSPALTAARFEAGIWTEIQSVLGNATIVAGKWERARDLLTRLQVEVTRAESGVASVIALEAVDPDIAPAGYYLTGHNSDGSPHFARLPEIAK